MQFSSSCALDEYNAHLAAAHGDHRYVCPSCGKLFKLRGSLLVHERIVHNPATAGSHTCSACGATFNNKVMRKFLRERLREYRPLILYFVGGTLSRHLPIEHFSS